MEEYKEIFQEIIRKLELQSFQFKVFDEDGGWEEYSVSFYTDIYIENENDENYCQITPKGDIIIYEKVERLEDGNKVWTESDDPELRRYYITTVIPAFIKVAHQLELEEE